MDDPRDKVTIRRSLLKQRRALPQEHWEVKSQQICNHLRRSPWFIQAKTILAYFSFRQEPDLSQLFALPHHWGFPRCVENSLIWHSWSPTNPWPLQTGAYGISEPHPQSPEMNPADADLILVPAVACDPWGDRLGYGGGFYDRLLSQPEIRAIPTIGIVFHFALVPQLPMEPWDQPLTAICTETGMITPSKAFL